MSTTLHLEEHMQRDVENIRTNMLQMCKLCEKALRACVSALVQRDRQLAYAVILRDQYIDEKEKEIDRLCLEFLVRQQPVARWLRLAYGAIKINLELERVGDYAESIARQTLKLLSIKTEIPIDRFVAIAELSIPMLTDAIRAFVDGDADLARRTIETEDAVDVLKRQLNGDLVKLFREEKIPFEALNPLMMITRRFERVSDQARNICMEVLYMCTGEYAKHPGSEAFRILFVDEHNSCRSQMAEAFGNSLKLPRFEFLSAGLDPKPIAPGTVAFMKEKGIEVSRMVPKAVHQVPHLDHCHVIVALAPEAKRAFPQRPRKVVFLDWAIGDPSLAEGDDQQTRNAYEETFRFIQEHVRDLVNAILGEQTNS